MIMLEWKRPDGKLMVRNILPEVLADIVLLYPTLTGALPPYDVFRNEHLVVRVKPSESGYVVIERVEE